MRTVRALRRPVVSTGCIVRPVQRLRYAGGGAQGQRGVTYLALMVTVAVLSAVLASTAQVISHAQQRDRELHLLWIGEQFRRAIVAYSKSPSGGEIYPKDLSELVDDRRRPVVQHHLRRVYFDPLTGKADWVILRDAQQRIIGVHSASSKKPIRTHGFPPRYAEFAEAETYGDWKFGVGVLPQKAPPEAPSSVLSALPSDGSRAPDGQPSLLQPLPASSGVLSPLPGAPKE